MPLSTLFGTPPKRYRSTGADGEESRPSQPEALHCSLYITVKLLPYSCQHSCVSHQRALCLVSYFKNRRTMATTFSSSTTSVLVISRYLPEDIEMEKDTQTPILSDIDAHNDSLDNFNHPRYRRGLILMELAKRQQQQSSSIQFKKPESPAVDFSIYRNIQSEGLIDFFETAWTIWDDLGEEGQDPMSSLVSSTSTTTTTTKSSTTPPLIPAVVPLPRDPYQRRSNNVMGQIGFYCTDTVTPIFAELKEELQWDVAIMEEAIKNIYQSPVVYALGTHPGHHAANDSYGGYCFLNHAAFCAKQLQIQYQFQKVAVLDVDYVSTTKLLRHR